MCKINNQKVTSTTTRLLPTFSYIIKPVRSVKYDSSFKNKCDNNYTHRLGDSHIVVIFLSFLFNIYNFNILLNTQTIKYRKMNPVLTGCL